MRAVGPCCCASARWVVPSLPEQCPLWPSRVQLPTFWWLCFVPASTCLSASHCVGHGIFMGRLLRGGGPGSLEPPTPSAKPGGPQRCGRGKYSFIPENVNDAPDWLVLNFWLISVRHYFLPHSFQFVVTVRSSVCSPSAGTCSAMVSVMWITLGTSAIFTLHPLFNNLGSELPDFQNYKY